uniref:Formin-like protein 16 n=1 Tax=Elaeis guineensis var. tenera TaxID=51953 RepID=A0A6J0PQK7_ELAGV|nr:formin-like protein 16 [Elaeis guineensis]
MAIPETLHKWRYHLLAAALAVAAAVGIPRILPSFQTMLGFFAPLLISTALVLSIVPIIARYSQKPSEATAGAVGSDILDFVAGSHVELPPLLEDRPPPLMPVEEIAPPPPVEETPRQPPMKETPPPPPLKETPPPPPPPSDEAANNLKSP